MPADMPAGAHPGQLDEREGAEEADDLPVEYERALLAPDPTEMIEELLNLLQSRRNIEGAIGGLLLALDRLTPPGEDSLETDRYVFRRTSRGMQSFLPPEAVAFAYDAGLLTEQERDRVLPPPKLPDPKVNLTEWNKVLKLLPKLKPVDERYRQWHERPGPQAVINRETGEVLEEV